ncbi:MAG: metal-dependent transcriptional regulator [Clostridia bacterium]|nr:metal-dependent transcriptional regulator [Clostridia bacterium]NCC76127.1 metal-dependent transcriptional regulator [Clostridia bacterium]
MKQIPLTPAVEDFLEAILALAPDGTPVRSIDVSSQLGISRAAVSKALANLVQAGLIEHTPYGSIQLTESGLARAHVITQSHQMLKRFLIEILGLDETTAEQDACRLEHVISDETRQQWLHYIARTLPD